MLEIKCNQIQLVHKDTKILSCTCEQLYSQHALSNLNVPTNVF